MLFYYVKSSNVSIRLRMNWGESDDEISFLVMNKNQFDGDSKDNF